MQKQQGFSLIELLIVVGIIAALSAIAVPAYVNKQKIAEFNSGLASGRALLTRLDLYLDEEGGSVEDFVNELAGGGKKSKKAKLGELATVTELAGSGNDDSKIGLEVTFSADSAVTGTKITFEKRKYAWQCSYSLGKGITLEPSEIKGCQNGS
ncbi:pilin [Salinivibrio sp. IB282]|uniref:pilin n=1 Tax=Salinivibrio sp. IB282 TaxID=1766122 RepID=UPI0009884EDA|nr:prepilin-type N-terminal cleavage/methylation domain-containing protein [Salinivibrio sp. IB282]OOE69223.1 hypothetical protein BZG14_02240 [Salinivibrio sp. IB282]